MRLDRALYSSVDVCPWECGTSNDLPSLFRSFRYPPLSDSRLAKSIYRKVGHFGPLPVSRTLVLKLMRSAEHMFTLHPHTLQQIRVAKQLYLNGRFEATCFVFSKAHFFYYLASTCPCVLHHLSSRIPVLYIPLISRIYLSNSPFPFSLDWFPLCVRWLTNLLLSPNIVISITAHAGLIQGFLLAIGREMFQPATGGESLQNFSFIASIIFSSTSPVFTGGLIYSW